MIDKFLIDQDKANHFVYGAVIATVSAMIFGFIVGACIAVAIAVGKEVYDSDHGGTVDIMDVVWTLFGIVTSLMDQLYALL